MGDGEVDGQRRRTAGEHSQRHVRSATVNDSRHSRAGDDVGEHLLCVLLGQGAHARKTAAGRDGPGQHSGKARLVDLQDELGVRCTTAYVVQVRAHGLGVGRADVADGAGIGEGGAVLGLQGCEQRPRTSQLHLQRAVMGCGDGDERIEVAFEHLPSPADVDARPRHQPPSGGLQVDVQVDKDTGGAPDHVGARTARGQLR